MGALSGCGAECADQQAAIAVRNIAERHWVTQAMFGVTAAHDFLVIFVRGQ